MRTGPAGRNHSRVLPRTGAAASPRIVAPVVLVGSAAGVVVPLGRVGAFRGAEAVEAQQATGLPIGMPAHAGKGWIVPPAQRGCGSGHPGGRKMIFKPDGFGRPASVTGAVRG